MKKEDIDITIADNDSKTALMHLSSSYNIEVIRLLIESGKDIAINAKDSGGNTALIMAASLSRPAAIDVLRLLFKHKDISPTLTDRKGNTALMNRMTKRSGPGCVELLIKHSAGCINTQNDAKETALMLAIHNYPSIVELLLAVQVINLDLKNSENMTALDLAKKRYRTMRNPAEKRGFEKAIKIMEQKPITAGSDNYFKCNILHYDILNKH